jgi:hypothetical protein
MPSAIFRVRIVSLHILVVPMRLIEMQLTYAIIRRIKFQRDYLLAEYDA